MKVTKDWIILLIFSLITVLSWIGFEVERIWKTPTFTPVLEEQMKPFSPELDQETLEILRSSSNP